jgi:hypothetical protein
MKFRNDRRTPVESGATPPTGPGPEEEQIGQVLLEIQSFAASATSQARAQADLVINEARTQAQEIVERATEEAESIRSRAALSADDIRELVAAIDEFTRTNRDLLSALLELRDSLEPLPPPPSGAPPPPTAPPPSADQLPTAPPLPS